MSMMGYEGSKIIVSLIMGGSVGGACSPISSITLLEINIFSEGGSFTQISYSVHDRSQVKLWRNV